MKPKEAARHLTPMRRRLLTIIYEWELARKQYKNLPLKPFTSHEFALRVNEVSHFITDGNAGSHLQNLERLGFVIHDREWRMSDLGRTIIDAIKVAEAALGKKIE